MDIAEFALERYFARWEFAVRYNLAASDVEPLSLEELLSFADADGRHRWNTLSLGYTESLGLPALRVAIAEQYDGVLYVSRVGPTHPTADARQAIARRERY